MNANIKGADLNNKIDERTKIWESKGDKHYSRGRIFLGIELGFLVLQVIFMMSGFFLLGLISQFLFFVFFFLSIDQMKKSSNIYCRLTGYYTALKDLLEVATPEEPKAE